MGIPDPKAISQILQLTAWQLEVALRESEAQIDRLSVAIGEIIALIVPRMDAEARLTAAEAPYTEAVVPDKLRSSINLLKKHATNALVAMQFHDQLVQRVQHVRDALTDLTEWLDGCQAEQAVPPPEDFLERIRAHYTMDDERVLFDAVLTGACGLLSERRDRTAPSAVPSSVELF